MNLRYLKIAVFIVPLILFLVFLCIKLVSRDIYFSLIQEDSVVEYAQAIFYFLSSIVSSLIAIRFLKNRRTLHGILYSILTLGLLLVSLEEISWGQRVFNIATPDYFKEYNVQREISLHNLRTFQPLLHKFYILTGAYGAFAWIFARIFVSRTKRRFYDIAEFIVPDWFLSFYFFFVFFIYTLFDYVVRLHARSFLLCWDQEPAELLLSLGFLLFVISNYLKSGRCGATASFPASKKNHG